jgi:hypothetical protein
MAPRVRTWIAIVVVGHITACSSTFKELSPAPSGGGEPSGKAGPFLNSPFFIAIETGVLIGGITQLYNIVKARGDRKLAEDNARREKQTAVLSSVANELPVYTSTLGSMRELKVWLEGHDENTYKKFGKIRLPREQVLKEYLEFYKLSLKTRTSASILTEVRSFYGGAVCKAVDNEEGAIKRIEAAEDFDDVKKAGKDEESSFDALLSAMAEEAKKTSRNGDDTCSRQSFVASPKK